MKFIVTFEMPTGVPVDDLQAAGQYVATAIERYRDGYPADHPAHQITNILSRLVLAKSSHSQTSSPWLSLLERLLPNHPYVTLYVGHGFQSGLLQRDDDGWHLQPKNGRSSHYFLIEDVRRVSVAHGEAAGEEP